MIEIKDTCYVDIYLDDKPLVGENLINKIVLTEGTAALFPAATVQLRDDAGYLSGYNSVTDGNSLRVVVGRSPQEVLTYSRQYRLYNVRATSDAPGSKMLLMALYDAPGYTSASVSRVYKGSSSTALRAIADECFLDYSGPEQFNGRSPNDSQSWMVACDTLAKFAQQHVARHGYLDEHSAMVSCVTSLGELRYRNLFDVIETPIDKIKYAFVKDTSTKVPNGVTSYAVADAQERSDAGLLNASVNYGASRAVNSLDGSNRIDDKVDVNTSGKYLAMNDQVAQTVVSVRHDQSLLDCGNTNANYEKAFYQNLRQTALFSSRISVMVLEPTAVQMLDPVLYYRGTPDPLDLSSNSDVFIVVGKTIVVTAGRYYCERLELVRPTLTEKGQAALKSAVDPGVSINAAIPQSRINPTALNASSSAITSSSALSSMMNSSRSAAGIVMLGVQNCTKAAGQLVSVVQAVQSMSVPQMVTSLYDHLPKIDALSDAMGSVGSGLGSVTSGIAAATQQVGPVLNTAVKQAQVLMPGGPLHCLAPTLGANTMTKDILSGLAKATSSLNSNQGMSEAVAAGVGMKANAVKNALNRLDTTHVTQVKASADVWNTSIAHITGTPINTSSANSNAIDAVAENVVTKPEEAKSKTADEATSKMLGIMIGIGSIKSPKYASQASYIVKDLGFDAAKTSDKVAQMNGVLASRKSL